ncbi:MAG TPA: hypothetical protein VGM20_13225 [Gemmatimonadales bacterium]|jgi:hypothetical protein
MTTREFLWLVADGSSAVEFIGFLIGSIRWRRLGPGQRAATLWFGAATVSDAVVLFLSYHGQNTQPSGRVWYAASVVLALEALARFQSEQRRVVAFRVASVAYVLTSIVLLVTGEPLNAMTTYAAPLHALVILIAAVVTVFRRTLLGRGDLFSDPGFLVAAGLIGYAVAAVFETLVAQLWTATLPNYVEAFFAACNILTALAEIVIIRALIGRPPSAAAVER